MLKQTALIFAFLAVALGLTPALEDSFFYIAENNGLSYELFQTRKGIIAYSIEYLGPNHNPNLVPQYLLIDIEAGNATPVLGDTVTACGQGNSSFDRIHYHIPTQNLVYFCSSNNSLLIIDQDDYTVQSEVNVTLPKTYAEAKLTSEGYLIAVLLTDPLYDSYPYGSMLIKISLQSYTVVNTVQFNFDEYTNQESVYGYAVDDKNNMFISTYIVHYSDSMSTITQNLYKMTLIGNAYQLTNITSFTNNYFTYELFIYRLYCVEQLIFMTIANTGLYVMTQEGQQLAQPVNTLVIAHQDGSPDLYALIDSKILRYTVQGAGYTQDYLVYASDMHVAFGNQTSSSSLLIYNDPNGLNFNVTDAETLETLYSASVGWDYHNGLILTNTTYCMYQISGITPYFQIFNRTSRQLIATFNQIGSIYYNEDEAMLYNIYSYTDPYMVSEIQQIDLQTGNLTTLFTNPQSECQYFPNSVVSATNKGGSLQMTLDYGGCYLIMSQAFGNVTFNPFLTGTPLAITVDYDTLSVYAYQAGSNIQGETDILLYTYNNTFGRFNSPTTVKSFLGLFPTSVTATKDQVVAYTSGKVGVINMTTLNMTTYTFLPEWNLATIFHDQEGTGYTILAYQIYSDATDYDPSDEDVPPEVFFSGQQEQLYGTNNYTVEAAGTGCLYYVADTLIYSVGVVRFYNACAQGQVSQISA